MQSRQRWVRVLVLAALAVMIMLPARAQTLRGYTKDGGYHYVAMGAYPQQADGGVSPILWRVLDVADGQAYLFSEYILFNHRVHEDYLEYDAFEGQYNLTEIFGLLNGPFMDAAFSKKEQARIIADEELGRVFLPTMADIKNKAYGLGSNKARQGFGTPYALANGLFKYRNTKVGRSSSPYWTRTRSVQLSSGVRCTKVDGRVGYIRCVVMNEGIRPAIRLQMNAGEIDLLSGTGTLDDPFVLRVE